MMHKKMINVYLYTRYERFWHWLQALSIILLLLTGFETHGTFTLLGFERAVRLHNVVGLAWLITFAFFVFWVFTTGEWRQYIPTSRKLFAVIRYYAFGIFRGEEHPVPKRIDAKHNPLQRLTYLALAAFLLPFQMVTGFLYWGYNGLTGWGLSGVSLQTLAVLHTLGAFSILTFLLVHVYMTSTGHSLFAHIRAMLSGWEQIPEDTPVEAWEQAKPGNPPATTAS